MKKTLILSIFLLCLALSTEAHTIKSKIHSFSKRNQKHQFSLQPQTCSKSPETWVNLSLTFNQEAVYLSLPQFPGFKTNDGMVTLTCRTTNALYEFIGYLPTLGPIRSQIGSHAFFANLLDVFQDVGDCMWHEITDDLEYDILDAIYEVNENEMCKVRVYLTEDNLYILCTSFYKNSNDNHEDYVGSFVVE